MSTQDEMKAVAWRWGHQFTSFEQTAQNARALGHDVQPLYASPSSEEVERPVDLVPLTPQMARAHADLYTEMKKRAEAAEATIERLKGEVANLQHSIMLREKDALRATETQAHTEQLWHMEEGLRIAAESRNTRLQALVGEKDAALKPFVLEGERLAKIHWAHPEADDFNVSGVALLKWGDFRRARAALQKSEAGE